MPENHAPPYVVIVTGGGLPDEDTPEPHQNDIDLAQERAFAAGGGPTAELRAIVAEAFKVGYHQAAMLHRAVAVYVLGGRGEAEEFARFMTREVDSAYARRASSPLGELLTSLTAREAAMESRGEVPS